MIDYWFWSLTSLLITPTCSTVLWLKSALFLHEYNNNSCVIILFFFSLKARPESIPRYWINESERLLSSSSSSSSSSSVHSPLLDSSPSQLAVSSGRVCRRRRMFPQVSTRTFLPSSRRVRPNSQWNTTDVKPGPVPRCHVRSGLSK